MGWFFRKKKKGNEIPKPVRSFKDEQSLSFPAKGNSEKIIEPEQFKKAAGLNEVSFKNEEKISKDKFNFEEKQVDILPKSKDKLSVMKEIPRSGEPLFVKVETYKKILGKIENLNSELSHLGEVNRKLSKSELKEEKSFSSLKSSVRNMHDKLLSVDEILFKS